MTVLVAGGSGFIGSHLVRKLVETGEKVVVFDLIPNLEVISDLINQVEVVKGDATQMVDILHAIKQHDVKDIYHLIGLLGDVCQQKPLLALKVNVETTLNFLEATRLLNLGKIIFASSVAVYDPNEPSPVGEDALTNPSSVYGAVKVLSEFYGLHYNKVFGVDFRALRFTTIYGLGKFLGSTAICSLLIEKAARGEPIKVDAPDAVTDWLYIKDAVNSLVLARKVPDPRHRVYNVGGNSYSVRQVIEITKKFIPEAKIEIKGKRTFPWPPSYDITRARDELGYTPFFTIEKGIGDFISMVRKI